MNKLITINSTRLFMVEFLCLLIKFDQINQKTKALALEQVLNPNFCGSPQKAAGCHGNSLKCGDPSAGSPDGCTAAHPIHQDFSVRVTTIPPLRNAPTKQ